MMSALLAFSFFAALLTITPGVDTALVIRMSLGGGARTGRLAGAGVCTGVLVWGFASAVGITALLTASERAFNVLRIAGAVYLVWLGVKALRARPRDEAEENAAGDDGPSGAVAFRTGLLSNLLNPKVGVFYLSVLPQFIPRGAPVLATSMLLAAVHALEGIIWLVLIATLVDRLGALFRRPTVRARLEQLTGVVLVGLGIRLAFEKR
jgi:RhtB (resistance to homoserine/threonine) family protein